MSFFNEKWKNSSVLTKVALWPMIISSLMLMICTFTLLKWERELLAYAGREEPFIGYWFIFLFLFIYSSLLTFGLFKVSNFARILTILLGLGSVVVVVMAISGYGYAMSAARELYGDTLVDASLASYGFAGKLFVNYIIPLIPASVLAKIGFYLFIYTAAPVFQVLSMLLLLFCGKDFKRRKNVEAQPSVS